MDKDYYKRCIQLIQEGYKVYTRGQEFCDENGDSLDNALVKDDLNWNSINHLEVGKCGELYAQYILTLLGGTVYEAAVDDHGIDMIVVYNNRCFKIQVKTVRNENYTFIREGNPESFDGFFLFYIRVSENGIPNAYLFPMNYIRSELDKKPLDKSGIKRFECFSYHKYSDKKSPAEYGIYASEKYFVPQHDRIVSACKVSNGWSLEEEFSFQKIVLMNN